MNGLVGRSFELHQLEGAWSAALDQHARLVVVTGEPGIGKTRLCEEVAAVAAGAGFVVAWGNCWSEGGAPPLWPWHTLLAATCGDAAADLLDGDTGVAGVDADRFSRFAAVAGRLRQVCESQPCMLIIDDAHAADAGTLLLARFVVRALCDQRLMVVLSRRAVVQTTNADLHSRLDGDALLVPLRRLDVHDATEMLQTAGATDPDPDLVLALLRVTGGIPLYLHRVLAQGDPTTSAAPLAGGLRAFINETAAKLPATTRQILATSAVLGPAPLLRRAAVLCGVREKAVLDGVMDGVSAGLVVADGDRFRFCHDVIREALEEMLSRDDILAAHAAASRLVDGTAKRAYHALRAAPRSPEDARRAVEAARDAATEMIRGFSYEQAASLLEQAEAVYDHAGLGMLPAALLVDHAQAVLLAGRLAAARGLFERAADAAEREGDSVVLATAAVGLGGVWLGERRTPLERARVEAVQRRALAALPSGEEALRVRLSVRLAAEAAYPGGPYDDLWRVLDEARTFDDLSVLAEALSLAHHAVLVPHHLERRIGLADDLIAVAAAAGEGVLALFGLCWRAIDLFHLGDARASRALAELRLRSDALQCQGILYVAQVMEVMLLIREGKLSEAEEAATSCYEFGLEVGDADALGCFGGQLIAIRWIQGRDAEMLAMVETIADSPTLVESDFVFHATVASLAARSGDIGRARLALARLAHDGLASLVPSSTWLAGMIALIEAAWFTGDAAIAREAYALIEPFADQIVMPSLAIACFGSCERALGLAAITFGELDRGIVHLERAVDRNRAIGNRPVTAISQSDLAGALIDRSDPADTGRAMELLRAAIADGDEMGMDGRVGAWRAALARHELPVSSLWLEGGQWVIEHGATRSVVPDKIGIRYLAQLLAQPTIEFSAVALAGAAGDTPQPVIDTAAREAYERRARDLAAAVAIADAGGDEAKADRLREEFDALVDELGGATGLGGRMRTFAGSAERARTSVRKAIKRALDDISAVDPAMGAHLGSSVTTGMVCCYSPVSPMRWRVGHDTGSRGGRTSSALESTSAR